MRRELLRVDVDRHDRAVGLALGKLDERRCPACSAPMVGTRATVSPARRKRARVRRRSLTVCTAFAALGATGLSTPLLVNRAAALVKIRRCAVHVKSRAGRGAGMRAALGAMARRLPPGRHGRISSGRLERRRQIIGACRPEPRREHGRGDESNRGGRCARRARRAGAAAARRDRRLSPARRDASRRRPDRARRLHRGRAPSHRGPRPPPRSRRPRPARSTRASMPSCASTGSPARRA